jgi:hypothetical protein
MRDAIRFALLGVVLFMPLRLLAGPAIFDVDPTVPPVILDSQAPLTCTVTYLIEDASTGDLFAQRIRVPPGDSDQAVDHRLPCPSDVLPRLSNFAREVCTIRALDRSSCVFADMSRDFATKPDIGNTAAETARCQSDAAKNLGVACWMNGATAVCNVGCGNSEATAIAAARSRCEEKQQRSCPATAVLAVTDQHLTSPDAPLGQAGQAGQAGQVGQAAKP